MEKDRTREEREQGNNTIPTLEAWIDLGNRDPVAQDSLGMKRDRELSRLWHCSHCGDRLPHRGFVWGKRYRDFLLQYRIGSDPTSSGYYCDPCADGRELGFDPYR